MSEPLPNVHRPERSLEPRLRGAGQAARLLDAAVQLARHENLKVDARCSYARAVLTRSPAYADVLA